MILQGIAETDKEKLDSKELLSNVRVSLKRVISLKYVNEDFKLKVILLDPVIDLEFMKAAKELDIVSDESFNSITRFLSDINLDTFFEDIYANKMYVTNADSALKEKIAMRACKSAIKAGMALKGSEIDSIIQMMKTSNSPFLCPHGRPYVIKILKEDIEKWFKRIV